MTLQNFALKACEIGQGRTWISVQAQQWKAPEGESTLLDVPMYQIWDAASQMHFKGASPEEALKAYSEFIIHGVWEPKDIELGVEA